MPALSGSQLATWRGGGNRTTAYLFMLAPTVVFRARVNSASFTYPAVGITYDTVTTGAFTDLRYGQTIWVGSSSGAKDLGQYMVISATSTVITLNRFSQGVEAGTFNLADNAYITVFEDYRIWALPPYIDNTGVQFKRGQVAYSTANATRPVANNTFTSYANYLAVGSTTRSIAFNSNTSYSPAGLTLSVAWNFGDGTPSTATIANQIVSFPAGFRYVRLTVTDTNSQSTTLYIPVFIASDASTNTTPIKLFNARLASRPDGQVLDVDLLTTISKSTYPDGTLAMLWEDEKYGDGNGSIAYETTVNHMKFTGWHNTTSSLIEGSLDNGVDLGTSLQFVDGAGRVKQLPAFQQVLQYATTPAAWSDSPVATGMLDYYALYILREHSSALNVMNFYRTALTTYNFAQLNSEGDNLYTQADNVTIATGYKYRLVNDRYNRLYMKPYPNYQETGDRTSTVIITLNEDDIASIDTTESIPPAVYWLKSNAIGSSATLPVPYFASAPGERPSQGAVASALQGMLVITQTELNQVTGQVYSERVRPIEYAVTLANAGDLGVDPALYEWVQLNMINAMAIDYRGTTLSLVKTLCTEVVTQYDSENGVANRSYRFLRETSGSAAQTVIMTSGSNPDPYTPPYTTYPNAVNGSQLGFGGGGAGNLVAISQDAFLYRTTTFTATSPTWSSTDLTGVGLPASSAISSFVQNPYNGNEAWVTTRTGIYKISNLLSGTPSCTLQHTYAGGTTLFRFAGATSNYLSAALDASFGGNIHIAAVINYAGSTGGTPQTGVGVAYSTNGSTWTENRITTTDQVFTSPYFPLSSIVVSSNVAGVVYIMLFGRLYKSTNSGASFSAVSPAVSWANPENKSSQFVCAPFVGNNGNICYYDFNYNQDSPSITNRLNIKRQTAGLTYETINTQTLPTAASGNTSMSIAYRNGMTFSPSNPNIAYAIGFNGGSDIITALYWSLLYTSDNWSTISVRNGGSISSGYHAVYVTDNANVLYLVGFGGALGYSADGGVTIATKNPTGATARLVGIAGG